MRSMQVKSKMPSDGSKVLQVDSAMRMVFMPATLHHFHICLQTVIRQIFQIVGCSKEQVICSHIG